MGKYDRPGDIQRTIDLDNKIEELKVTLKSKNPKPPTS
jgi:hypothetical protein